MSTAATTTKSRSYKELLTTSLHRRFTNASLLILAFCWLEATLISSDSLLTAWIPFGYTGLRTLLLFIPCLNIFIIRVSHLHFGKRTTKSSFETLYQNLTSTQAVVTFGWYFASSQFFGLVYLWSKGAESNLGWIDQGRAYERPRVNENPVILRYLYGLLAVLQTAVHIYYDLDWVPIGQGDATESGALTWQSIVSRALPIAKSAFNVSLGAWIVILPTYYFFVRHLIWTPFYNIARLVDGSLPHNAGPPGIVHEFSCILQGVISSILLTALWGVSNAVFTIFMSQPPLKKGEPITSDMVSNGSALVSRAADANGTLINGLTRKKESPHTFALWELYLICSKFDTRRKSIFSEVDRNGGSTWTQVSQLCLKEIQAISTRIQDHNKPATISAQPAAPEPTGLPRIAEAPKQGDILAKGRSTLSQTVTSVARSAGQHPGAANPLSPGARKAIAWSADQVFTKEQQQQISLEGVDKQVSERVLQAFQTPFAQPFRETFARTAKAVVFGTPYSSQLNIKHAARSLAALLKASLTEDTCGVAAKDVPTAIRTLLASINATKQFLSTLQPSWTDVDFRESHRQVPEVLETVSELQSALEVILLAFSEYASSLGVSKKELREAKEAVGIDLRQQMMQIR